MEQTLVTFLLDRSGSMQDIKPATIEAFNAYLDELRKGDLIRFTLLQFDTESLDKVHVAKPINEVPNLMNETFVPRGGTPLIDACVKTIKAVEEAIVQSGSKPKVVVCFQTDGHENSSTEHTNEELRALIEQRTKEGWQFNFMGAGINAYEAAGRMGIGAAGTVSYDHTDLAATRASFGASGQNTRSFAAGMSENTNYSAAQKFASGDKFDPAVQSVQTVQSKPVSAKTGRTGRRVTVQDFKL